VNITTVSARLPAENDIAWMRDARMAAIAIIAVSTALKLAICPLVDLGTNEAYAIASGRAMSLSYFDHPPLHFWLAHLSVTIFGYNAWARIPFIALGAGTSWLMFAVTRRMFGGQAGVWAALTLNLTIFFDLASGNWILPDGPLNFFLLATAYVLVPTAQGRSPGTGGWAAAGVLAGLAALSKYHAFVFLAGYLAFLLVSPRRRGLLLSPGPWLAALLALVVFSPVILWNAETGWASLRFQGGRAVPHHFAAGLFLSLLLAQFLVLLPGAAIPLVAGLRRSIVSRTPEELFVLFLGLPIALLLTIIPLFTDNGMMHWAMPGWLLLLPLAGKYLADRACFSDWPRRAALIASAFMFVATVAAALEFQSGWLGTEYPRIFKHGDPTWENASWSAIAAPLSAPSDISRRLVLTSNWRDAAKIDAALGGHDRLIVTSPDPRNFAVGLHPQALRHENGWIVLRTPLQPQAKLSASACFAHVSHAGNLVVARNTRPDATLIVFRGDDFIPYRCKLTTFPG